MRRSGWVTWLWVALAVGALVVGINYLFAPRTTKAPNRVQPPSSEAAPPLGEALPAATARLSPSDAEPAPAPAESATELWAGRFALGTVALETRFVASSADHRVREAMLRQPDPHAPLAVWRERQRRESNGAWKTIGFSAHSGDRFLLSWTDDSAAVNEAVLQSFLATNDAYVLRRSDLSPLIVIGLVDPTLARLENALAAARSAFAGTSVEVDCNVLHFTAATTPEEWRPDHAWGLEITRAPSAWDFTVGSDEVVIAVLDTGMQLDHPDLAENLFFNPGEIPGNGIDDDGNGKSDDVNGWDFYANDSNPSDESGHGTHVAGIAAARGDNGQGVAGVNWRAKLLPLRVGGQFNVSTEAIIEALDYAADLKRKGINIVVTNNSYGSESPVAAFRSAIQRQMATDADIVFVAATGNEATDMDNEAQQYPAGYTLSNIISVANSSQEDLLTPSSNYGLISADLSAPGEAIYSTYLNDSYTFLSGTSMASPLVAGAVALLASSEPELTGAQMRKRILDTVDIIPGQNGRSATGGRLNILHALRTEQIGRYLRVANVAESLLVLDDLGVPYDFVVEGEGRSVIDARIEDGAAGAELTAIADGIFRLQAHEPGLFRIRFESHLAGVVLVQDRFVAAGAIEDVAAGLSHRFDFAGEGVSEPDLAGDADGTFNSSARVATDFGGAARFGPATDSSMQFAGRYSEQVTIAALVRGEDLQASPHPRIVQMPYYYLYFSSGLDPTLPDGNRETLKFLSDRDRAYGAWNSPPRSIAEDNWYYVVGSYDGSRVTNVPELYINGRRQPVWAQQSPLGNPLTTPAAAYVGNSRDSDRVFVGDMAALRIYDRQLSDYEIARLGARLAARKWDRFAIAGGEAVAGGVLAPFAVLDEAGTAAAGSYRWTVLSDGAYEIDDAAAAAPRIRFFDRADYVVAVQVADGMSSRRYVASVPTPEVGMYYGDTSGGGRFWLELNPVRSGGALSIYDPASGLLLVDEPVTINGFWEFASADGSDLMITGALTPTIAGEVAALGVTFAGAFQGDAATPPASMGSYGGGVLAEANDALQLRVLSSGNWLLQRVGSTLDLASGAMGPDGAFSAVSANGATIEGAINVAAGRVDGVLADGGASPFYLEADWLEDAPGLAGGVVIAPAPGVGELSPLAHFAARGAENWNALAAGALAKSPPRAGAVNAFIVASPVAASAQRIEPGAFSEALAARAAELGVKPLRAVAMQATLRAGAPALIGFEIEGDRPRELMLRALGPSFGAGTLGDTQLRLLRLDEDGFVELAANDDWAATASSEAVDRLRIAFAALGLSDLDAAAKDSALRIWLAPGSYALWAETRQLAPGDALVEAHELAK